MFSVFAVLVLIVGIINIVSYVNIVEGADGIVTLLKQGGGTFGSLDGGDYDVPGVPPDGEDGGRPMPPMSPETPFETRYFTVVIGDKGEVKMINTDRIAAVNDDSAASYATRLFEKGKRSGFSDNYRYGTSEAPNGDIMYIFVDCTRELTSYRTFLVTSIAVGFVALIAVFVLVFFISGRVIKPLAESYEKQKRFITDASHELKTPLTVIGANTEVLEMQGVENEWTRGIKDQVKRLTSLTEKMVFLARMDEENQNVKPTDFSLSGAVEESVKPFTAVALSRGNSLIAHIQPNLTYRGDESMIRRLVGLLVDNAIKYSDEGMDIDIELKSVGKKLRLTVTNSCTALTEGEENLLFERFYRSDKSRNSETGGHGIGLSVAQSIVNAHKGSIKAEVRNGTVTFTVIL